MKKTTVLLILTILVAAVSALAARSERDSQQSYTMEEAMNLFRSENYESAARAFRTLVNDERVAALAWFQLGASYHHMGRYEESISANMEAAKFPAMRASATYNVACSYSLLGETDEAARFLDSSIELGFQDFDLISADPDLENLRAIDGLDLPDHNEFKQFEAENSVHIEYTVKLPTDYDPSATYPAALVFPGGSQGPHSADWAFNKIINDEGLGADWIVICPSAPEDGWINLATHTAFGELLNEFTTEYNIEGDKFHLIGFGNGGFTALVYAGIAPRKFHSLSLISFQGWSSAEREQIEDLPRLPILLVAGSEDQPNAQNTRDIQEAMSQEGIEASVLIINGDGFTLSSLPRGMILGQIGDRFRDAL